MGSIRYTIALHAIAASLVLGCPDTGDDDAADDDATAGDDDTTDPTPDDDDTTAGDDDSADGTDADGDGWSVEDGDCDDTDPDVNPGMTEVCNDGLDNDCDGTDNGCGIAGQYEVDEADAVLLGEAFGHMAGDDPTLVGDLDGDGYQDLVVSSPQADLGFDGNGLVHVVLGPVAPGPAQLADAHTRIIGLDQYDHLGEITAAGDVNGDGHDDFLLSAVPNGGRTHLLLWPLPGGDTDLSIAATTWVGEMDGDHSGVSVASGADVNGDGEIDFLIGASCEDTHGDLAGAVYLVHGPASAGTHSLSTADIKLLGEEEHDQLGINVAMAGDVNGDGVGDVLVAAPNHAGVETYGGAVYLLTGPLAPGTYDVSMADAKLNGSTPHERAGHGLAPAGDLDGDGFDDFLVAGYDNGNRSYLIRGPVAGNYVLEYVAEAIVEGEFERDGTQYMAAGDVDGDGVTDFAFGSVWYDNPFECSGASHLVYGPLTGNLGLGLSDASITGTSEHHYAYHVALGDLTGDGFDDLVIGAHADDTAAEDAGAVYVFFGGTM